MSSIPAPLRRSARSLFERANARVRPYRFVIYACARSGSTALVKILNHYAGIHCASEPFNANFRERIADLPQLRREIAFLWSRYNGFKHVWNVDGWPFRGQPLLNDYVLTGCARRVILMHRRNVLQRIVSDLISHQSNVWHVEGADDRARLAKHAFGPLDPAVVRRRLESETAALAAARHRLEQADIRYRLLSYEELFSPSSPKQQLHVLAEVIAFVTDAAFKEKRLAPGALDILDPAQNRLNSSKTYDLIPRIREIEDEFGSQETGYLFR